MNDFVLVMGAIGFVLALVLLIYFAYWIKTKSVTQKEIEEIKLLTKKEIAELPGIAEIKDVFDEIQLMEAMVIKLTEVIQSKTTIEVKGNGNGNGHQEEEAVTGKAVSLEEALNQIVNVEETQPPDIPSPEEQKQVINDRMAKARAARGKRIVP